MNLIFCFLLPPKKTGFLIENQQESLCYVVMILYICFAQLNSNQQHNDDKYTI